MGASEVLRGSGALVPDWADSETAYPILADVPEPALFQLPTILRVHKPDQRIHVTRDVDAVKRQAIALTRDHAIEGIVDAYLVGRDLRVILGDMRVRSFPAEEVGCLAQLGDDELRSFEIQSSGSYLLWRELDLRVGASQLLQAVDPTYLAEVVIERYAVERMSLALRCLREEKGLTQEGIGGLSGRHVRRLEKEAVRLTSDAARKYADAFGTTLDGFLAELARCISRLEREGDDRRGQTHEEGPNLAGHG